MKLVRKTVMSATSAEMRNGAWTRHVTLSCGHVQEVIRADFNRVSRTIQCHRCTAKANGFPDKYDVQG